VAPKKPNSAFRFETPRAGPYGFVATGNRIVVTGPKIDSAEALTEAARAHVAALELARTQDEQRPADQTPAEPPRPPAAPPIAPFPPAGTVPFGNTRSDSLPEQKS
jgi:hypothetical protein